MSAAAIPAFWEHFVAHADELARIESADDPVYDAMFEKLQAIDEGLFFQFATGDPHDLVITAEGDSELFPLVEQIVAAAPSVAGWTVTALKPKLGFPVTAAWEGVSVAVGGVLAAPALDDDENPGLILFVPEWREADEDDLRCALLQAIDHGLGERRSAEVVTFVEVRPLAEAADGVSFPLTELEQHLDP